MTDRGPVSTALRISRVSSPELANVPTALKSLLVVPLLEVLLIVVVSASLGGGALVVTAYAAILLAYGLNVVTGVIGQVTRDRQIGVFQEALTYRFFHVPYWLGKVSIPSLLGGVVAIASCAGVLAIDSQHSARPFLSAVVLLPLVGLGASLAAIGIATLSVGFKDPYLVSNIIQGVLPLSAGVIVPLASYPAVLAGIAQALPLTAAVEAMRATVDEAALGTVLATIGRELLVCTVWLALGLLMSRYVVRALRDGRRREEIW